VIQKIINIYISVKKIIIIYKYPNVFFIKYKITNKIYALVAIINIANQENRAFSEHPWTKSRQACHPTRKGG